MAKGKYEGVVVGAKPWEIKDKNTGEVQKGVSYLVMTRGEVNAETGLPDDAQIVFASTPDKQLDKTLKDGTPVTFLGEYKEGFNGEKGKMRYTDLKAVKVKA